MSHWIARPGGKLVRFRNRPTTHHCSRRKHGRPAVGNGLCYGVNVSRRMRHSLNAELRRALRECEGTDFLTIVLPRACPSTFM